MQTDNLEYIASLVLEGYTYGYSPDWEITFSEISRSEVNDNSLLHISKLIKDGYIQGEIQQENKSGWWFLKLKL
ncbi:MAG: hypothetical protein LBN95_13080 [Prevotellaceae bacterium]|jgi:hypothetical protein|nr:hypothetical protein [Prevotellaceae bacterium]